MTDRSRGARVVGSGWAVGVVALLLAAPVAGQSRDFLFSAPRVTVAVRGGWAVPTAGSEIFDFTMDELTVERSDFQAFAVDGEVAVRLDDRLDLAIGVGHSERDVHSEFRDFVEDNDLPIRQTTRFQRTPIEVGLKGYLKERGRAVSRFAWVPYDWAPYLALGAGAMVYDFDQYGDFVDYETLDIFTKTFESDGTVPTAHAAAGVDFSLHRHLLATAEGRYQWARADMSRDFVDFDPIDLSGFQITVGLAARF